MYENMLNTSRLLSIHIDVPSNLDIKVASFGFHNGGEDSHNA